MNDFDHRFGNVEFRALTQATFRLNNLLLSERDRIGRDLGITSARWQILETLGQQILPASPAEISRRLQISRQAVQRVLKHLSELNLVLLATDENDQRAQKVTITPDGAEILKELDKRTAILRRTFAKKYQPQISEFLNVATAEIAASERFDQEALADVTLETKSRGPTSWSTQPPHKSIERTSRTFESVKARILEQIRTGKLMVGDRLPPERELASSLAVGRSAVREALRSLEVAGVLRFKRGSGGGAFVRDSGSDGIEDSIRTMLILGRLPLMDLLDLRASLLAQCARLGAQRGTHEDFERLDSVIEELEIVVSSSQDQIMGIGPATEFYRLAARSTHNPLMVLLVSAIANLVAEMLVTLKHRPRKDSVTARREMLAAMRAGSADDAARVIRLHSDDTNKLLLRYKIPTSY
ncbi:hypothetical protein A8B75_19510 [Sphingomonadales bacterium EhC05]|nr:hypothetical protein A8B75_19510 [Sphingomonadales bacterium EhC05]